MIGVIILVSVLIALNIVVILIYIALVKQLPPPPDNREFYDENGNHIYYDRKLIRQLEKEKESQ